MIPNLAYQSQLTSSTTIAPWYNGHSRWAMAYESPRGTLRLAADGTASSHGCRSPRSRFLPTRQSPPFELPWIAGRYGYKTLRSSKPSERRYGATTCGYWEAGLSTRAALVVRVVGSVRGGRGPGWVAHALPPCHVSGTPWPPTLASSRNCWTDRLWGTLGAQTDGIHGSATDSLRQVNGLVNGC
jgi:hypothetical protein